MKYTRTHARTVQTPWQPELFGFPKKGWTFPKFAIGKEQLAAEFFSFDANKTSWFADKKTFLS